VRWSTHLAIGVDCAAVLIATVLYIVPSAVTNLEVIGATLIGALLGSLLPDLDARQSKIKYLKLGKLRPFYHLSILTSQKLGHRGVLHSLLGLGVATGIGALLGPWWGFWTAAGMSVGYGSHLIADSAAVSGIPWLFPRRRRYHLTGRRLRIVTGSLAEESVFALSVSAALLLLILLGKQFWPSFA
jgi:inner membrane protein